MTEVTLGIDIGTASTKATLCDLEGNVVALATRSHGLSMPQPGWAEHDAIEIWWRDVVEVCREILDDRATDLKGVCVSGIGPCLLATRADLTPVRPAILYGIDTRATDEIAELETRYGASEILASGGSRLSSQAVGPKLLWLRRHEPDAWAATERMFMASSYVVARLSGEYVLDHHSASQCDPLYHLETNSWVKEWADDIAPGLELPRLAWPGEMVGVVHAAASEATLIPRGTPVMAGTIDAWAEALSVGVRKPGDLMLMYGSTIFIVMVTDGPSVHPTLWSTVGTEPGTYSVAAGMATGGSAIEWIRGVSGGGTYEERIAEAELVPPGADGLLMLPYLAGERSPIFDPRARGVIAGLTLRHTPAHLLRAAYEATAFGVRGNLEVLTEAAGPPKRIVAVGGGVRSDLWTQIVSDVANVEQLVPEQTVGASYGDALLAAIGIELVPPGTDWTRPAGQVAPVGELSSIYDARFAAYRDLYRDSADVVHRLADA